MNRPGVSGGRSRRRRRGGRLLSFCGGGAGRQRLRPERTGWCRSPGGAVVTPRRSSQGQLLAQQLLEPREVVGH